jgi:medium-chain acyl-[acyl-carrier-protein] hydrolase
VLNDVVARPLALARGSVKAVDPGLSDDKRKLLGILLRKRAPAGAWFPGIEGAARRLFWFPHAGGGTNLPLPGMIAVRLPGREARMAEAPFERMTPLVEALANAIEGYLDLPFAFFGHSMGAAAAFELARCLRRRGRPQPCVLIVSGARAPQFRRDYSRPPDPDDEQLLADLRRLQGIPSEALEEPEVLRLILPPLRADTALYRHYVYRDEEPLACPIRAYGGDQDPNVRPEHLEPWAEQTNGGFRLRLFPGGHFYYQSDPKTFLQLVAGDLAGLCGNGAGQESGDARLQ